MLYRKPRVGQEINAYCGKCKLERTHIIAAMDGEAVRKVTCSMCGGTHNYKLKPAAATKTVTRKRAAEGGASGSRRAKSSDSFSIDPSRPVKTYDMNSNFSAGDVISHPKFGLGTVEGSLAPNKIEVRFREGRKVMLHNMKSFRA